MSFGYDCTYTMFFISQTLPYSFCACVRNTPKIVTFVIGKMKMVYFSLFLEAFPPRPKVSFGQRHVAINIYNLCKGHFGSRGEASKNILKDTNFIFLMTNDTILSVFRTHAQKEYGYVLKMKSTPILNILALLLFLKLAIHLLKVWPKRHPA